ncbi:MAG TPA: histidine kinase [Bacteroidales bacterium]|nr:histidine kinase [Bacteroidales bacterium]
MATIEITRKIRLGFWHFQIMGWIAFEILIQLQNLMIPVFHDFIIKRGLPLFLVWWTSYDMIAFFITSGYRYLYRYLINRNVALWINLLIAFLVSLLSSVFWTISGYYLSRILDIRYGSLTFSGIVQSSTFLLSVLFGWSVIYFGIKYWIKMREEKERADKATLLAHISQLKMLRYQLNPHFLFNSLNSISALIDENKKASKEMIAELAEFLRYTLLNKDTIEVPLSQEIEAIKLYLSMEKKRFEEKLEVNYHIDPVTEDVPVLSFVLHQLVENAVKYGMKTSPIPLRITVSSSLCDGNLILSVINTGKWVVPATRRGEDGTGTGLNNIRMRLDQKFPGSYTLRTSDSEGKVTVTITLNDIFKEKHRSDENLS